jgi:enoyl-CoA hydratase/carnithine racemase
MSESTVKVETRDSIAIVSLNRPHRNNAWTGRMHAEYKQAMSDLDANSQIRAIVVTGEGNTFCVGGDSSALAGHADRGGYDPGQSVSVPNPGTNLPDEFNHDLAWHFGLRVPVIASVNGACAGIGLALTLFCDMRFISASAKCTTAAPKLGLPAEYGMSWMLPRIIGLTRANDILLSGRIFTGEESRNWGLWNDVASDGPGAREMAITWATMLASTAGPNAVTTTKRQIYTDLIRHDIGASIDESISLIDAATKTAEYREGIAALIEKRPPRFS